MTRTSLRGLVAAIALCVTVIASAVAAADPPLAGLSLEEALQALERRGLKLLYSSQVVTADMRVTSEPTTSDPAAALRELLAPHGLKAVPNSAGGFAIVRAPAPPRAAADRAGALPAHGDAGSAAMLEEVVVHASRYSFRREGPVASTDLPRGLIETVPGVSEDAARILQRLPGTASNGLSARTHVRGSFDDELLVRFDDVRLYNPYHLKDYQAIFGLLDPEVIDAAEYFSGGFPARYGWRSGGVFDITPRVPEKMETLIGVSTLNSRLVSSGLVFEGKGQWLAAYRRSNLNAVLRALERDVGEPEFEDFVLRYQHELRPGTTAVVGVLALDDRLDLNSEDGFEVTSARYRDRYVWARIEQRFDNGLLATLQFDDASLSSHRSGDVVRPGISTGVLDDQRRSDVDTVTIALEMPLSSGTLVSAGAEASDSTASYEYMSRAEFFGPLAAAFGRESGLAHDYDGAPTGSTYSAFAAARHESGPWAAELGLRWDRATYGDVGSEWSPRLSVRRQFENDAALRLTVGRYVQMQGVGELDVELQTPMYAPPESAWHAILGYEHQLPTGPALRLEAFGKRMDDVRARWENVLDPVVLVPDIEVDRTLIAPDRSQAWGVEVSLTEEPGQTFGWWLNYTWSEARDEFAADTVARSWDQRHALAAGAMLRHGRWEFTLATNWHSGWPATPLTVVPGTDDGPAVALGARNSTRFADYFSLDARVSYRQPLPIGALEFEVEVLNLTNRENVCCREFEQDQSSAAGYKVDYKGWLGIAPIVGVNWRF